MSAIPFASLDDPESDVSVLESAGDTVRCVDCGEQVTDLQAHCESEDNICLIHDSQTVEDTGL